MKILIRGSCNGVLLLALGIVAWAAVGAEARADGAAQNWVGVDAFGGYQGLSTSTGNNSLSGGLLGGRVGFELRGLSFGELSAGLGFQETWQSGNTSALAQSLQTRLPVVDVGYAHSLLLDRLYVGALFRNQFGVGAHYNFADLTSFQYLFSVGPKVEYRWPLELWGHSGEFVAGIAGLYGLTGGTQTIWQVPASVGLRIPLDREPAAHEEAARAGRDSPRGPSPAPEPSAQPSPVAETPKGDIAAGEIAQILPDGVGVTLPVSRVSFDVGQATVSPAAQKYLDALAQVFVEQSANWDHLDVSGHIDNRGPEPLNVSISHQRARAVTQTMLRAGIAAKRLRSRGAGSSEPLDNRNDEEGWKRNRRVLIHVFTGTVDPHVLARALNDFDRKVQQSSMEGGAAHE